MATPIAIRAFAADDRAAVLDLFIKINRRLAPPHLAQAFEDYIAISLREEIHRIADYYSERHGSFWVATAGATIAGMFGLERSVPDAMELRRMYVDPDWRRRGIARTMLQFAEDECRRQNIRQIDLSTSEIQHEALSLYRNAGYRLVREDVVAAASHKTVGGNIRRYYFTKLL